MTKNTWIHALNSKRYACLHSAGAMLSGLYVALMTLVAWGPFGPLAISNSTSSPARSDLKPSPTIPEKWTKTSSPPGCSMNPNPFLVSNHFTTPFAAKIVALLFETVFTAAFDIINQFRCQDFYVSQKPSLPFRDRLSSL